MDPVEHGEHASTHWLTLLALTVPAVAWLILGLFAVVSTFPNNPLVHSRAVRMEFRAILPEGWSFFTRDPRSERFHVYFPGEEGWARSTIGPPAQPKYAFGLNRAGRTQGIELGLLLQEVREDDWTPCEGDPGSCLVATTRRRQVTNPTPRPVLCGPVGIVRQKPVPWAWAKSRSQIQMPGSTTILEVSC